MVEQQAYSTIKVEDIIVSGEGFNLRNSLCRVLSMGNCPDPDLRRCADCRFARADIKKLLSNLGEHNFLVKSVETTSNADRAVINVTMGFDNGTECVIDYQRGFVTFSKINPK